MKLSPLEAARRFAETRFPGSRAVWLAGSASRGEHKISSDLDIVIIDDTLPHAYRESFYEFGWRIEAFLHTSETIREYFVSDRKRARPTLPSMCAAGTILKDDGTATSLRLAAQKLLDEGPDPLTPDEILASRYFLTDLLDDFIDAERYDEALVTMNTLSIQVAEFVLRANGRWIGRGKALARALRQFDEPLCGQYIQAISTFSRTEDKRPFVRFVDEVLEPYGGRLFEGFSMGKPKS
ncbi:nucleotidyltransferase domain-containing protein [Paenibacillus hamazuiensis]|uniref:nucleotidyltransferase domain-containing protein n=1 Tax=Paenibacillus hamazuiensis TaxID=2936508 RepID=UPI00200F5CFC|nr:nucleotidyltransferase domain-containing protein [Paenibacillus hamazuiensis]